MRRTIIIISLVLLISCSYIFPSGPFENRASEYISQGFGGAALVSTQGAKGVFVNPAGLSRSKGFNTYFHWAQKWEKDILQQELLSTSYTTEFGAFGAGMHTWGDKDLYQELTVSGAYSKRLLKDLVVGLNFHYYKLSLAQRYGSASTFGIDMGANYFFNERIAAGLLVVNANQPKIADSDLPQKLFLGTAFFPVEWTKFELDIEIFKNEPASIKIGEELILLDNFHIKTGISGQPINFHAGISYSHSYFNAGWSYFTHPNLGGTQNIFVNLHLPK